MIRKGIISDLDSIEETYLEHFAYEEKHGAFTVFKKDIYPTRIDAKKAIDNQSLYVYVENNIVLGSIILNNQQPKEYRNINWKCKADDNQINVIHLLMIRPSAAKKGIGSSLINYALETAKRNSCIAVRLDTGAQNVPAVSLYKKLGFNLIASAAMNVGGEISHKNHLFFEKTL